jgi:hypothetical protein
MHKLREIHPFQSGRGVTETGLDKPRALTRFLFNFARRANKGAIQRAAEWTGHAYLGARNGPQLKRLIRPLAGSLAERSQHAIERAVPVFQIAPDLHRIVGAPFAHRIMAT